MGQKLIYVPECHSTNSSLSDLINHGDLPEGLVLITDNQTKGRGQRGNHWDSLPGENLTFSILLKPKFLSARDQFQLNMAIALGIADGLSHWSSQQVSLKWPNDIMIADKKVAGVLIESQSQGVALSQSIVGIGLNVKQKEFAHPLAASLLHVTGKAFSLQEVFETLMSSLEVKYLQLRSGNATSIRSEYVKSLFRYNLPQSFEADGDQFEGVISDVDEFGRLCVNASGTIRKFSMKEIRMIL
jgi:BirA family biotin operon repressor/biotin-[acetyl-CoA-carboxylase] ligase